MQGEKENSEQVTVKQKMSPLISSPWSLPLPLNGELLATGALAKPGRPPPP